MRALLFVAVVVTAAFAGQFSLMSCDDLVGCYHGCSSQVLNFSDQCYLLPSSVGPHGDTWDCNQITRGPCFTIRGYPAGSGCGGDPVDQRVNYCDECKGADPLDYEHLQHRRCRFGADGSISAVDFFDCGRQVNNSVRCDPASCASQANATFRFGQCVTGGYKGLDWRLEEVDGHCKMMRHVNYRDRECKDMWWGDNIVLGKCNQGWRFDCGSP